MRHHYSTKDTKTNLRLIFSDAGFNEACYELECWLTQHGLTVNKVEHEKQESGYYIVHIYAGKPITTEEGTKFSDVKHFVYDEEREYFLGE